VTSLGRTGPLPIALPGPRVVALGGGHGLAATLAALRHVTPNLTAVVTVADDGGSSGRLRAEFGVLPPGDLRMALAALTEGSEWGRIWRDVLQHRFASDGDLSGHAVGNLLILALWQLLDDPIAGLELVNQLLGGVGRVLPMSLVPLEVEADVTTYPEAGRPWATTIRGQHRIAVAGGRVDAIRLIPPDAPACPEAVAALRQAEWIVLGPGSWYTSVIPHMLIPELRDAIASPSARRIVTLNLTAQSGETPDFSASDHLDALAAYSPGVDFDVIVADPSLGGLEALRERVAGGPGRVLTRHVRASDTTACHDALRLAAAYRDAINGVG
jgi:uncharacterized cofD-like protein